MSGLLLNSKEYSNNNSNSTPLIILHGLLGSLDNWQSLSKQFSEHFPVISMDLRNHGKSPHSDEFSYTLMVDDVIHTLDHLKIKQCVILGHSMGAKLAMFAACKHSDRFTGLIAADMAPRAYQAHHNEIFQALSNIDIHGINSRQDADEILSQSIPEFGVRQFLLKNLDRNEQGFEWKMNLDVLRDQYEEVLKELSTNMSFSKPVLMLRGENSHYIQDTDRTLIEHHFPNSKIQTISNSGHWLHAENPKEVFEEVLRFINSLS